MHDLPRDGIEIHERRSSPELLGFIAFVLAALSSFALLAWTAYLIGGKP